MAIEQLIGLEEGKFTKRDEVIKETAERLKNRGKPWHVVGDYVTNLMFDSSDKSELFRRRTASQIITSGFVNGCTDSALVFLALIRELGVPSFYVETFDKNWLLDLNNGTICGHIFVDIKKDGKWRHYEPNQGYFMDNAFDLRGNEFVEAGKGIDFSELYVKKNGVYGPKSIRVQTTSEIRELANIVRI